MDICSSCGGKLRLMTDGKRPLKVKGNRLVLRCENCDEVVTRFNVSGEERKQKKERSQADRRTSARALTGRGYVRVKPYLANIALQHDLPHEVGPHPDYTSSKDVYWVPAWLEWHMKRFENTSLADVSQRERLEQAKALIGDKDAQLLLLCEAQLAGCTLADPDGDLATIAAINLLKKELDSA